MMCRSIPRLSGVRLAAYAAATLGLMLAPVAEACTRAVCTGANGEVITARSMDFAPNTIWVDLNKLDFRPGAAVRKLELGERQAHAHVGEVTDTFVASQPFRFMGHTPR